MNNKPFYIKNIIEGKNSVLFDTNENSILYEKLANTIHSGKHEQLKTLQDEVESIDYKPIFESDSLKKRKNEKLESLLIKVTESCNLSCSYCIYSGKYENESTRSNLSMSFETAKKAINFFMPKSKRITLIGFYGGEPLNNMDLIKRVIKYIKIRYPEKTSVFSMTSNFCDADKHIEDLVENEIYVNVSLDGPKQIHDKNRVFKNGKPTYTKIIENLEKLEKKFPGYTKTHFSYNSTCKDQKDLSQIIKFFQENEQFTNPRINGIESKGLKEKIEKSDDSEVFTFVSNYLDSILTKNDPKILRTSFDKNLRNMALRSIDTIPGTLMLNGACYPGNKKLFVDTDGKFYICERFGTRVPIGDVEEGINQNLVDAAIKKFLEIRNTHCTNNCWTQRLCNPCIQSSKDSKGSISIEGLAQTCESNKSQVLVALANYAFLSEKNKKALEGYIKSIKFK